MKHISLHGAVSSYGADEGDRTLVPSLGSSYSTTELHPHELLLVHFTSIHAVCKGFRRIFLKYW